MDGGDGDGPVAGRWRLGGATVPLPLPGSTWPGKLGDHIDYPALVQPGSSGDLQPGSGGAHPLPGIGSAG